MNERQYHWLCNNRRGGGPLGLGQRTLRDELRRWAGAMGVRSALAAVVSKAARGLQRHRAAAAAWQSVAEPEWLLETAVDSVQNGVLVVIAGSSAVCCELSRHRATLERSIAGLVPGVHRLRFVVAGQQAGWDVDEDVRRAGDLGPGGTGG